jgi:hypothetical protein
MGTAVTAIADGPYAAYWNLGVLGLPDRQGGLSYSERDLFTPFQFFGLAGSWEGIGVGGHLSRMHTEQPVRTIFRPDSIATFEATDYFGLIGAGIDIGRFVQLLPEEMVWGVGAGIGIVKTKLASYEANTWDIDLGTIFSWQPPHVREETGVALTLRAGYALRNVRKGSMTFIEDEVSLRRQDRFGLAAVGDVLDDPRFGSLIRATISMDRRGLFFDTSRSRHQVGGEVTIAGIVSGRGGYIWDAYGGDDDEVNWGLGVGLEPGNPFSPHFGGRLDYVEGEFLSRDFDQLTLSLWVAQ